MILRGVALVAQSLLNLRWEDPITQKLLLSFVSAAVIYGLILLGRRILNRAIKEPMWRYKSRKFLYYSGIALLLLLLLAIWSENISQFAVGLGVVGVGLALALQQAILSLAGWLYIVTSRPFDVGDRVEVNGIAGDVIDIRVFKTVLLEIHMEGAGKGTQSTGRVVDIPNSYAFSHALFNYTRGFEYVWNDYPIQITFESNWERAVQLVSDIVERETRGFEAPARKQIEHMGKSYLIQYGHLTSAVFVAIRESGVELAMRYLTPARGRRQIRDRISREILNAFAKEPDIELAYPTYRVLRNEEIGEHKG